MADARRGAMIPRAVELVEGYRRKTISPVEATRAALAAIDRYDPMVNAFVLVDADGAMAAAKASEARWHAARPLGPADGVPTSIKDALWTRGWPTLRGSWLIDEAGPWDEDAPSVARLRETGAVLLGKTTTPEYSWKGVTDSPRYGVTGNPWNPATTAGGSSGGSAAAVCQRINNNGQPQAALPPDEGEMLAAIGLIVQLGWIDLRVGR